MENWIFRWMQFSTNNPNGIPNHAESRARLNVPSYHWAVEDLGNCSTSET